MLTIMTGCNGAPFPIAFPYVGLSESMPMQTVQANPSQTPASYGQSPFPSPTSLGTQAASPSLPAIDPTPILEATPAFDPASWEQLPVIPVVSLTTRQIYAHGQALGNDPHAFSKIGDCETSSPWFLADFDAARPGQYSLGPYTDLQPVIQQFAGSYKRTSLAARDGFIAASILNPIWAPASLCEPTETPLACEVRLHRPSFAIIMLGTNDFNHQARFEPDMRTIIQFLIAHGVVPILATKADNLEEDNSINITIARLAYEYDIPLWNTWAAVHPLPNGGLQLDKAHLAWAPNFFDNSFYMQLGWPVRNLTALQALNAVWSGVTQP